jgi:hypothetical protein
MYTDLDLIVNGTDSDTLVGDSILYTPNKDYSRPNAVADVPDLTYQIFSGNTVNQTVVRVTATQKDADSSEFIELSGIPEGVTATPSVFNPSTRQGQYVQDFVLNLPLNQDVNFNLGVQAVSKETSSGDKKTRSVSIPIVLEYNENSASPTFLATGQSIWDNGNEFTFTDNRFIGIDGGFKKKSGGFIGYDLDAQVKAGFQSALTFKGGDIDANLKYDLGVNTNYNKTTDSLLLSPFKQLAGGDFTTVGPQGSYKLDFLFNYKFNAALTYDVPLLFSSLSGTIISRSGSNNYLANILNLNSNDLSTEIGFPRPFDSLSATLAWPNIATDANPTLAGRFESNGASNNFLKFNIDVDQALADIFLGGANPFNIPFDVRVAKGNLEIADLDLNGGLNFLQAFALEEQGLTGDLKFENGSTLAFTPGTDILLPGVSQIDASGNNNGKIDFDLILNPQATLSNKTDLGFNVGYNFDLLKATGRYGIGPISGSINLGPVYDTGGTLPIGSINVYNDTFGLNFASQDISGFST